MEEPELQIILCRFRSELASNSWVCEFHSLWEEIEEEVRAVGKGVGLGN